MYYCDDSGESVYNDEEGNHLGEHFPKFRNINCEGTKILNQLESPEGSQAGCYVRCGAHQLVLKQMMMMPMMLMMPKMLMMKIKAMMRSFPARPIDII